MRAVRVRGRYVNGRQPSGLNNILTVARVFFCVYAYVRDKNTSAKPCPINAGGAYARGWAYLRDTTVHVSHLYDEALCC